MKVVIAGGSGLIGRAVSAVLVESGYETVVLTRSPERARLPRGVRVVEWQPPSGAAWAEELEGADAVVNLAGASVGGWWWTPRRRRILRESRLVPTATLVAALADVAPDRRPHVFVNASGTDLYEGRDDTPVTEDAAPVSSFLAKLVLDWEAAARQAEEYGMRVVLLRTSLVVAPGAPSLRLMTLPFRCFAGGRIGSGRQWVSWIALDDAVGLIVRAIEDEAIRGPINLSAPDPRRQAEVAQSIGRAIHRPAWLPTPAWAVRLVLGQMATLALGSRRVWPARALEIGYRFRTTSLDVALDHALGQTQGSKKI